MAGVVEAAGNRDGTGVHRGPEGGFGVVPESIYRL